MHEAREVMQMRFMFFNVIVATPLGPRGRTTSGNTVAMATAYISG